MAVPVGDQNDDNHLGVLLVGVHLSDATVKELKLPRTEILFLSGDRVLAATVSDLGVGFWSPAEADKGGPLTKAAGGNAESRTVVVAGEHYMARSGVLDAASPRSGGLEYIILSSYEQRLQALDDTRRTLLEISLAAVIVGALVISWIVRRVTRPLRELRDTAEAIGRGDFSRRLEPYANDECGDLADSFNRMTVGLQTSRAELERAVDTLKNTQTQLIQSEKLSAVGQFVAGVGARVK